MTKEQLLEKARLLPASPGVYIMRSASGKVIYVGKSKALCNRVSSYFSQPHTGKTARLVAAVNDFEVYHTGTELEALLLENQFIKQYMPRYNIKLKDSSGYPYIRISDGDYPDLSIVYRRENGKARYFGPFSSYTVARGIADTARRTFGLPTCGRVFPRDIGKGRPCLNAQIGICSAPCIKDHISAEEYRSLYDSAARLLGGDYAAVTESLTAKMESLSDRLLFEDAARCRDCINAVKKLGEKQHIVGSPSLEGDFIGVYRDDLGSAVNLFFVRRGAIADRECLFFGADEIIDSASLVSLFQRLYTLRGFVPAKIYTRFPISDGDRELFSHWANEYLSVKAEIVLPQRGEKKELAARAEDNAQQLLLHRRKSEERDGRILTSLASLLCIETVPRRIEALDISNSGDEFITAGLTVIENGRFAKRQYRSFNIRFEGQNDCAAVREAVDRRFSHPEWENPDLLLIDGGDIQTSAAKSVIADKGLDIPVFGMVKDEHHKTRSLTDGEHEIGLTKRQDLFVFIYRIQEEVHRFALSRMDARRRKSVSRSSLTAIKGVGDQTALRLIEHFGSYKAVSEADIGSLMRVKGMKMQTAEAIRKHFEGEKQ